MARVLSRTGSLARRLGAAQPGGILGRRHHHTRRQAAEALEVDAAGPSTSAEVGAMKRRLEEAIDRAMARMAEPDWAPFRPGTSYYAPPRPAGAALGLLALVGGGGGGMGPLPRALSPSPPPPADTPARPISSMDIFRMKWRAQDRMRIQLKRNEWKGLVFCTR